MSELLLKSLDITNFRSIRGHVHAPLDARVVLVHGENGAGKTSLLSAIELALTGRIQALERADPGYEIQLLHRTAIEGSVCLRTIGDIEQSFQANLTGGGVQSAGPRDDLRAAFFRERVFLPQSMLGQLLQIYQESGSDAASPLAQFVGKLLGLDRLDALEAGLKPFVDLRNVRKAVDGWSAAESEKNAIERSLADQRRMRDTLNGQVKAALDELTTVCAALELAFGGSEEKLDEVAAALADNTESEAFARLTDQQRRLASIRREIADAQREAVPGVQGQSPGADDAGEAFARWDKEHGALVGDLRDQVQELLPDVSLPSDPAEFGEEALKRLRTEQKHLGGRVTQMRADLTRLTAAQDEHTAAVRRREVIDEEVARLPGTAGSLASALSELASFIATDICPVCDRDFGELGDGSLSAHVHVKVRTLSASAERLLVLGRSRSEAQVAIERLAREIETIAGRQASDHALAEIDRRLASMVALVTTLDGMLEALRAGARLRAAEIAARRAASEAQSRHVALAAARETLSNFALSIAAATPADGESFEVAAARIEEFLAGQAKRLDERLAMRRRSAERIAEIRAAVSRRKDVDARIAADMRRWNAAEGGLERAQELRTQTVAVRNAVDKVRSAIIRREFNDRLNRVWRDLFVRLAPGEPFVPAFRIPPSSTQKLQPKLITEHRGGGEAGGTPGAMLSAGNLNTAALTLFIALHLSVPGELPWLILDDPVQSMDDVHIAHFAALLRTLSKEHGRQVMIAVHDRQLFEYLKLELSPAFPDDSLLTLELSRGPRRDTLCRSDRLFYQKETGLYAAA